MLNQLENQGFYKLHSNLHIGLTLRFHSKTLETLLTESNAEFYNAFAKHSKERDGVHRCNMLDIAKELGLKPYKLTRLLYQLQHFSADDIAYDLDDECFILEILNLPGEQRIIPMANDMLAETRKIE